MTTNNGLLIVTALFVSLCSCAGNGGNKLDVYSLPPYVFPLEGRSWKIFCSGHDIYGSNTRNLDIFYNPDGSLKPKDQVCDENDDSTLTRPAQ